MGFLTRTKKIVKPFVDVPTWIGFQRLADTAKLIANSSKELFNPAAKAKKPETFDQAVERLKMTDEDVQQRLKHFKLLFVVWLATFFLLLAYAVYLASERSWVAFVPCMAMSFLCVVQVFRYHFWIFQVKQRKLGCGIKEWLNSSFSSRGSI